MAYIADTSGFDVHALNQLKKRFISDYSLPIVVFDERYFGYYLELYERDFKALTKWNELIGVINERFQSNPYLFLDEYSRVRDSLIQCIRTSDCYASDYENNKLDRFNLDFDSIDSTHCRHNSLYINDFVGKTFISVDLRKANYQAMKTINPDLLQLEKGSESYEEWVRKYTDLDYIVDSKYTRQVVFGNVNPKKQIKVQRWIVSGIIREIQSSEEIKGKARLVIFNNDEAVFEVTDTDSLYKTYSLFSKIVRDSGADCNLTAFFLDMGHFLVSGEHLYVYMKKVLVTNAKQSYHLYNCPNFYHAQVYKLINRMDVEENDLKFYFNGQIATFDERLVFV